MWFEFIRQILFQANKLNNWKATKKIYSLQYYTWLLVNACNIMSIMKIIMNMSQIILNFDSDIWVYFSIAIVSLFASRPFILKSAISDKMQKNNFRPYSSIKNKYDNTAVVKKKDGKFMDP